jgi:hypothetical protein
MVKMAMRVTAVICWTLLQWKRSGMERMLIPLCGKRVYGQVQVVQGIKARH